MVGAIGSQSERITLFSVYFISDGNWQYGASDYVRFGRQRIAIRPGWLRYLPFPLPFFQPNKTSNCRHCYRYRSGPVPFTFALPIATLETNSSVVVRPSVLNSSLLTSQSSPRQQWRTQHLIKTRAKIQRPKFGGQKYRIYNMIMNYKVIVSIQ